MSTQPALTLPRTTSPRAEQDRLIANAISLARQLIEIARSDPEIAPGLAARGFDAGRLAEGLALQAAAQAAFTARQTALAAQRQASAARLGAELTARQAYLDFRQTARAVFTTSADRTALAVTGHIPEDVQRFLTTARASYAAGQAEPYSPTLAAYGYAAPAIDMAVGTLDALSTVDEGQNAAIGAAIRATAERNEAMKALDDWMGQFRRIARVALRGRRDLLRKLEL